LATKLGPGKKEKVKCDKGGLEKVQKRSGPHGWVKKEGKKLSAPREGAIRKWEKDSAEGGNCDGEEKKGKKMQDTEGQLTGSDEGQ